MDKDGNKARRKVVGNRLRDIREALGFETKRDFAEYLGVHEDTYGIWENGRGDIPIYAIERLRERHRITADWILFGDPSGLPHKLAADLLKIRVVNLTQ